MFSIFTGLNTRPRHFLCLGVILLCNSLFAQVVIPPQQQPDPDQNLTTQQPNFQNTPLPRQTLPQQMLPGGIPGNPAQNQPSLSDLLGKAELEPAKSILRLQPLWPYYLAAAVVALLILTLLLIWIFRKKRKEKPIPVIPADMIALSALEALQPLIQQAKGREFSYEASEIIRGYIEERYGVSALNCTTREFLDKSLSNSHSISEKHQSILRKFLNYCDLAKFAKQVLPPQQLEEMYQSASGFVLETRPSIMAMTGQNSPEIERKEGDVK